MRTQAVILLMALVALAPLEASAKPRKARGPAVDAVRFTPYAGAAGAGRAVVRERGFRDWYDMRAGGHLGGRLEFPISRYFSLGGLGEFGATSIRGAGRADLHFDVSFWAKGRYVFDFEPLDLEIYVGVPLGMTFALVDWYDPGREFGPGLNSGLLFGAQILFERGGLFTDMGPRFRRTWYDDFDYRTSYGTRQFNVNFGGVIYF